MSTAPYALLVRTPASGCLVHVSRCLGITLGYSELELSDKAFIEWIHPDDRPAAETALASRVETFQARHATACGDWVEFFWRLQLEGEEVHLLGQPAGSAAAENMPHGTPSAQVDPRQQMLTAMALIVESKNPGMRCSILLVNRDDNRVSVGAGPSLPAEYNDAIEGLKIGPTVGSCGTASFWNVPVVVENIHEDPLWRGLGDMARAAGVAACWSHPIRATNGEVLGAMALYDTAPGVPAQHQMDGLAIAAHMVGLAIERDELEVQLRQAAKMEALGMLAGGVAHDFNNILAVVLGNAELALESLPARSEVRDRVHDIAAAAETATALCNQMLALAGRSALNIEVFECNATIRSLSRLLMVPLSKKATLRHELVGQLGVTADRSQLHQVLLNLITNAAEAVGNNAGEVLVATREVHLSQEDLGQSDLAGSVTSGAFVEIKVQDTGCGMGPTTRARLFDPFYSTKADGRGLGLTAVKGIVEAHGWLLRVESEPEKGSTLTLLLPRVEIGDCPVSAPEVPNVAPTTRILVADDEPGVLNVITRILERAGMEVLQARDGQEAIDMFRKHQNSIDCVLLDLNMPKLDGEEAFRGMKRIRNDVCALLSSGFAEQELLDRNAGSGLCGVVQKPVRMATLLKKVEEALASRAPRPARVRAFS